MSVLLRLDDVHLAYGDVPGVRGVDLALAGGEIVVLVGPNGAGKTTLLRIASGLLRPDRGRVRLGDEDLARLPRAAVARRLGGLAAEETSPFPFTVRETVALGRHPWRGRFGGESEDDRRAIDDAMDALDLQALADRPLPSLSSGERRRAALARCLAQGGEVLLLDEPTSHLDLGHRLRVLELLRARVAETGAAMLLALHDLALVPHVADRVVLLVDGRVAGEGPPREVLTPEAVAEAFGARVAWVSSGPGSPPALVGLSSARAEPGP